MIAPLVFASILSARCLPAHASQLGKISFLSIGTLLNNTLIAALVGVLEDQYVRPHRRGSVQGSAETALSERHPEQLCGAADLSVPGS